MVTSHDPQQTTAPRPASMLWFSLCPAAWEGGGQGGEEGRGRGMGEDRRGCPCSSVPERSPLFSHSLPLTGVPSAHPGPPPPMSPPPAAALQLLVGGSSGPGRPLTANQSPGRSLGSFCSSSPTTVPCGFPLPSSTWRFSKLQLGTSGQGVRSLW